MGRHARRDEARRRHRADRHRRRCRRPRRPGRAQRCPGRGDHARPDREVRRAGCRPGAGQRGPGGGLGRPERRVCRRRRAAAAPGHRARRPAAALLHVRHHRPPQARRAHPGVVPRRPPLHRLLARAAAGRPAPQPVQPRVGQARVVVLLRPVDRRGDRGRAVLREVRRRPAARRAARERGHQLLRPAHGVADAHQRRPDRGAGRAARGRGRGGAAEPRGHRAGAPRVGPRPARRLRPDRDDRRRRQHAGVTAEAGVDGPPAAGGAGRARRPVDRRPHRRPG